MKKVLLVALSTVRGEGDEAKKVRFEAGRTVDLTKDEKALLDKLTKSTGRPHYRDPVNESAEEIVDEPDAEETEDAYLGESVAMDKKNVPQLQAYLDHEGVEYASDAVKAGLLKAAKAHEADGGL